MAYTKKIWKDYPDTTTPILAEDMNNIENGIEAADTRLNDEEMYVQATAGANGDFFVNLTNQTLVNGRIVKISFPSATNSSSNARLSIDNGVTYKNIFLNGVQSIGTYIQGLSLTLMYDGTRWEEMCCVENAITGVVVRTNEFLEGKRIYKKRINLGSFPNDSLKKVAHGLGAVNFVKVEAIGLTSNLAVGLPFTNPTDLKSSIAAYVNGPDIDILTGTNRTSWSGYATVYFTYN